MKKHYSKLNAAAKILLIVGGLCWGFVGAFDFDLVGSVFGQMSVVSRIIYVLVGLAAVFKAVMWFQKRK